MDAESAGLGAGVRPNIEPAAPRTIEGSRRRMRIQIAAALAIGACVIAALWLIISVVIEAERSAAIEHARRETNNLGAAFRAEVEGKLDAVTGLMDFIAGRMRAEGHFDVWLWAREHQSMTANVMQSISLISPQGVLLSTSREPRPAMLDRSDRDYFKVHLDGAAHGTYVGQLVVGRSSEQPRITISRRVETDDGRFLGVLAVSLSPAQFTVLHMTADMGERDALALVGFDHVIRARFSADGKNGVPGAGLHVPPPPTEIANGTPAQWFIRAAAVDRVTRLYNARPLDRYPLYVVVAYDLDSILRPTAVHARSIRWIGVIVTIILGGLALMLILEIRRRTAREVELADDRTRLATEVRRGHGIRKQLQSSEQRLHDFAVMASDWFWEQDANLRFTEIGIEAPMGPAGSRIGKYRWEANATTETAEFWAAHKQDLLDRRPFRNFRFRLAGPDGTLRRVSINGIPVYDDTGEFAGYRGTGRDITTEFAAEADLREAKNRAEQAETLLRDAVDSIAEGFVIYDSADRLILCNDAYRRMYPASAPLMVPGVDYETLIRNNVNLRRYPEAVGREEEWIAAFMAAHRRGQEMETQLSDGKWVLVTDRRMRSGGIAGLRVNITALKTAQVALRESEERLDRAQEIAGIGGWELDIATGRYIWSKQMYRLRGLSPETFEPTGAAVAANIHPEDLPAVSAWIASLKAGQERDPIEIRVTGTASKVRVVRLDGRPVADPDGVIRRLAGTTQDVTERRLIDRQLAQAQKMEAIGNLTGGMAHDFNNGLGVIIGNLDLLRRMVVSNETAAEVCDEAREAAVRCADLIRGLLAFARRQPLQPRQTDVNALVRDTARLLARTLGEDITLKLTLNAALSPALADPAQLEAALVNLATNARDAMPKGGQLRIATRNARIDAQYVALHPEAIPGEYVLIEISDTGTGIAPEIVGRIFEPFFTTKETGKGSGLGLAMVFGFIKQSGGNLDVYSEPGLGTTFRLYLPPTQVTERPATASGTRLPLAGGDETILLVEDNSKLRQVAARQLTELGYRVLEAENAETALRIVSSGGRIDLLFTDVVMPGAIDGVELARQVGDQRPRVGILLTSGFPGGHSGDRSICPAELRLLGKPYNLDDLAHAVRQVLDERNDDEASGDGARREPESDLDGAGPLELRSAAGETV